MNAANGFSIGRAVAYRHGTRELAPRKGPAADYRNKDEVAAIGIAYPKDVPPWFEDLVIGEDIDVASARVWNFAQDNAPRKDAQIAAETVITIPRELTEEQTKAFAKELADEFADEGFFVDWSFHDKGVRGTDSHNPHLHVMQTLRPLVKEGLGQKRIALRDAAGDVLRSPAGKIRYTEWAGDLSKWKQRKKQIEVLVNKHLAMAGHDVRVDCRSNAEKGNGRGRSVHIGPGRYAKDRPENTGKSLNDQHVEYLADSRNLVRQNPSIILDMVTEQRAVFTMQDTNHVFSQLGFEREEAAELAVDPRFASRLIPLSKSSIEGYAPGKSPRKCFTTPEMQMAEGAMINLAAKLFERGGHRTNRVHVDHTLPKYNYFSQEQRAGVRFLTDAGDLKSLVGRAGTGKSTLLRAANEVWELTGYNTIGVTLAGKAAEELQRASGIDSRTLASLSYGLSSGQLKLTERDIVIVDEAGMIASHDLLKIIEHAEAAKAKLVLVGDPNQLPAIAAGAAFRAILQEVHPGRKIETIRRQSHPDHRKASQCFAAFDTKAGLNVYENEGAIHKAVSLDGAVKRLSSAFVLDHAAGRDVLAISYRRTDVRAINTEVRRQLKGQGKLDDGVALKTTNRKGEIHSDEFSRGDRIVFLQKDKALGVNNGTIAVLQDVSQDQVTAWVGERKVQFDPKAYDAFAHGYAVTIHKSQGASVDHVHLLASPLMDRNLTYVGMTRHKEMAQLYYDQTAFPNGLAAKLSQANDKATTRDYITKEDVVRFGERRGLDTRSIYDEVTDFVIQKVGDVWQWIKQAVAKVDAKGAGSELSQSEHMIQPQQQKQPIVPATASSRSGPEVAGSGVGHRSTPETPTAEQVDWLIAPIKVTGNEKFDAAWKAVKTSRSFRDRLRDLKEQREKLGFDDADAYVSSVISAVAKGLRNKDQSEYKRLTSKYAKDIADRYPMPEPRKPKFLERSRTVAAEHEKSVTENRALIQAHVREAHKVANALRVEIKDGMQRGWSEESHRAEMLERGVPLREGASGIPLKSLLESKSIEESDATKLVDEIMRPPQRAELIIESDKDAYRFYLCRDRDLGAKSSVGEMNALYTPTSTALGQVAGGVMQRQRAEKWALRASMGQQSGMSM